MVSIFSKKLPRFSTWMIAVKDKTNGARGHAQTHRSFAFTVRWVTTRNFSPFPAPRPPKTRAPFFLHAISGLVVFPIFTKRTPNPELSCHCPRPPTDGSLIKGHLPNQTELVVLLPHCARSSNGAFLSPIKPQSAVLGVFLGFPRTDGRSHGHARGGVRVRVRQRLRPREPLHQPRRRADRQPPRRRGPPLALRLRRRLRRPPRRRRIHLQGALRRRARRAPAGRLPRSQLRGSVPLQAPIAVRAQAVGAAAARHQLPLRRRQDAARRRDLRRRHPEGRGFHLRRGDDPAHGAGGAGRAGVARALRDAARVPRLLPLGVLPAAAEPAPARRRQEPRRRPPHPRPARGEDGRVPGVRGGRVGAARRRRRGRRRPPPRLPRRRGRLPLCK